MPPQIHDSTPTQQLDTASSSEAASLHGHKAMTPIIAGSVCGGVMAIAYIVGFTIYFVKRRRRKERKRKLAASGHYLSPLTPPARTPTTPKHKKPEEKIVVPPDPAIVLGLRRPGENAFGEPTDNSANSPPPTSDITSAVIIS